MKFPKRFRRITLPDCDSLEKARIEALVDGCRSLSLERFGRSRQMPALWRDTNCDHP